MVDQRELEMRMKRITFLENLGELSGGRGRMTRKQFLLRVLKTISIIYDHEQMLFKVVQL